jgi:hypothetical protein
MIRLRPERSAAKSAALTPSVANDPAWFTASACIERAVKALEELLALFTYSLGGKVAFTE